MFHRQMTGAAAWMLGACLVLGGASAARAQTASPSDPPAAPVADAPQTSQVSVQATSPKPTFEIYGFAMLDIGYDFGKIGDPNWQDDAASDEAAGVQRPVRQGPRTFEGVRQSRFGVQVVDIPTEPGRHQDEVRVRALRRRRRRKARRRSACVTRVGEWRGLRAGQTWSPFMDPRCVPGLDRVLGPDRHGVLPQRPARVPALAGRTTRTSRSRSNGRARAPTRRRIGDRFDLTNVVPRFPAPDVSADLKLGGEWGHVRARRHLPLHQVGRPRPTPVMSRPRVRLGRQPQREPQGRRRRCSSCRSSTASAIENYMNDAGVDVGAEERPRRTRTLGRRRSRCRCSASSRSSISSGATTYEHARRLLAVRTSTTPTARRPTRSTAASTRSATCCYTRPNS